MTTDILPVILSICYIILAIENWMRRYEGRRIEREIKALYQSDSGYPEYEAALDDVARILDIELDGS